MESNLTEEDWIRAVSTLVRDAWEATLQRQGMDARENFFVQGGDSMLATLLMSRLSEMTASELTLGDLYDHPTLEEITAFVLERFRRQ